jgi:hypothetical protein
MNLWMAGELLGECSSRYQYCTSTTAGAAGAVRAPGGRCNVAEEDSLRSLSPPRRSVLPVRQCGVLVLVVKRRNTLKERMNNVGTAPRPALVPQQFETSSSTAPRDARRQSGSTKCKAALEATTPPPPLPLPQS